MKCWEPLMICRVTGKRPCLSSTRRSTAWLSWPGKAAPRSKGCSRAMPSRLAPRQTRSGVRGTTDGESLLRFEAVKGAVTITDQHVQITVRALAYITYRPQRLVE